MNSPPEVFDEIHIVKSNAGEGKAEHGRQAEVIQLPEKPVITITRKQIYDEAWKISVAGMAKKYAMPYAHLLKQIKAADIPIPPSGYWTKLAHGKPTKKPELPGLPDVLVKLYETTPDTRKKKQAVQEQIESLKSTDSIASIPPDFESELVVETDEKIQIVPETRERYGQTFNVYDRKMLYQEVWKQPVTEVAKRYRVSDVAIHKVCKSLNIPTPPAGYWAKKKAGKSVPKPTPLPVSNYPKHKEGVRTAKNELKNVDPDDHLAFLEAEERSIAFSVAEQLQIPDADARLHTKIISHRKKVVEWQKELKINKAKGWGKRNMPQAPFLADTISEETLSRVCRIFDVLIKAMEPLGCSLTDQLNFIVNGETVRVTVTEAKDEVKHIPTREENIQLLKYEEERRRYSYASKPNIRKYDHPYNGRICFTVYGQKSYHDCKSYVVEDKLGEIMLSLYEASELVRQEREAREEAERKRQEETREREERRERYNLEVERTNALVHAAEDYEIACKIRAYISAKENSGAEDEETKAWIMWAKQKVDWLDPTIARKDEYLGKREYEKDEDAKKLKKSYSSWGW
nr:hypothetical protein [Clostridium sp. D33t1_170424_F3]